MADTPVDYGSLARFLMTANGTPEELLNYFYPERRSQRGRAQIAESNRWDRQHEKAVAQAEARRIAEANANSPQPPVWTYSAGSPGRTGLGAPNLHAGASPQTPARVAPPQRPYPGQGAPVHPRQTIPTVPQMSDPVRQSAQQQSAVVQRPQPAISPQDYYELLRRGSFRMG
jgi:hypothetical protein